MNWLQLVLLILSMLKQAKQAESADSFVAATGAVGANGELLKWLWDNRQAIIDFITTLIKFMPPAPMGASVSSSDIRAIIEDLNS